VLLLRPATPGRGGRQNTILRPNPNPNPNLNLNLNLLDTLILKGVPRH